ncbi:MAG: protein phosphatase 2C domain-containing protein [Gammaproteobacteria bacterium]|nr:protein phosphatase 2C domain-containing protein [Gammaproteobacteria bacterium]
MVSRTDRGSVRSNNEDAVAVDPTLGVAILADGMGGLQAGEVASAEAVDIVRSFLSALAEIDEHSLNEAISTANARIFDLAEFGDDIVALGTTLVVWTAAPGGGRCMVANVGDSRAYRLRDTVLTQLTRDHSLIQQLIDSGALSAEQARGATHRNVITRAVGLEREVTVDIETHDCRPGDLYLLCSDGLTDMLSDAAIEDLLEPDALVDQKTLRDAADNLIEAANAAGGADNISIALIVI